MRNFEKFIETSEASLFLKLNQLAKRNITIGEKRTSVTLEPQVWTILHEIAQEQQCTIHDLCTFVNDRKAEDTSLASAIRVFLMSYLYINLKRIQNDG